MGQKRRHRMLNLLCAFLIAAGITLTGSDLFSAEKDKKQKQPGPTQTAEVTLQKKMPRALFTKEMRVVRVSRHTSYVDQNGKGISYDLLSVPCKALLVYEPEPQADPVAVSITVKQLLPGSSRSIEVMPQ